MTRQPVFSFWTGADLSAHEGLIAHWRSEFPQFAIYGDADVRRLIARDFPDRLELYDDIRIPTAKSDVALLILLYELGGLYIDCHCGYTDAGSVRSLLASLLEFDAVFVDRILSHEARPVDEHLVINSIVFARPRFELLRKSYGQALANFARQRDRERAEGFTPYDVWSLSGPGLVTAMLMEPGSFNRDVRAEYWGRIMFVREEVAPIRRDRFRGYSAASVHWSLRQKSEGLFVAFDDQPQAGGSEL
jgi:hypothetical protein